MSAIEFVAYQPEHVAMIELQPHQESWRSQLARPEHAAAVAVSGMSWSGLIDGRVVGCGGFLPMWKGRVVCWLLISPSIPKRSWCAIVAKIKREFRETLAAHGRHRIEATTPADFDAGCRLARILGFEAEGLLREFGPDRRDHIALGRIICAS